MWISGVKHDQFKPDTVAFLDKFYAAGKLSKTGKFTIKDPIGARVPYELLPLRIKRIVKLMPIDRAKFVSMHAFKAAILNLYIYGYIPDADPAVIATEQHWRETRRKWHSSHPKSRQNQMSNPRSDKSIAWAKNQEDVRLYMEEVGSHPSSFLFSARSEKPLAPVAVP